MAVRTSNSIKPRGSATYVHRSPHLTPTNRTTASDSPSNHSVRNYERQPRAALRTEPSPAAGRIALVFVSHNQESVIVPTIRSAIASGQDKRSVFVLDRYSTDHTSERAAQELGTQQVVSFHTGRVRDLQKAVRQLDIDRDYRWLFVADADLSFGPDYFRILQRRLDPKTHLMVRGTTRSLHGNWLGTYRDLAEVVGRGWSGLVQLSPWSGSRLRSPVTGIRLDALRLLRPGSSLGTFDTMLQLYRSRAGKILTLRPAVSFAPQPSGFKDFCRRTLHQQRSYFQTVRKYHIGRRPQLIDVIVNYKLLQLAVLLSATGILLPLIVSRTHNWLLLPLVLIADYWLTTILTLRACLSRRNRRLRSALPYFYFLRWVELAIYVWAFMEIMAFDRYHNAYQTAPKSGQSVPIASTPSRAHS